MQLLLRLVWLIVLIMFLRWLFSRIFAATVTRLSRRPEPPPEQVHGVARKDPQCGIYIAEELAVTAQVGGQTHYFCSPTCRDQYLAAGRRGHG